MKLLSTVWKNKAGFDFFKSIPIYNYEGEAYLGLAVRKSAKLTGKKLQKTETILLCGSLASAECSFILKL
jgi:hypothetical protein